MLLRLTYRINYHLGIETYSFAHRSSATGYTNYILMVNGTELGSGNINLVGVMSDGLLGFGLGSVISSAVNYDYDLKSNTSNFKYLGNGITTNQFLFNSSVGVVFGAKGEILGYSMKRTPINRVFIQAQTSLLYSLPSNGISKAYEETYK